MTPDELSQIWLAYAESQDPELQEILVIAYEPLARYLARRALAKAPPYQDAEDILSYAHHGLLNAIERFDPSKGFKFETYATRRIAGAIIDGQRKQDPLGRPLRRRVKAMAAAIDLFWAQNSRSPSISELSAATGETEAGVRELYLAQQTLTGSLDEVTDSTTEGVPRDVTSALSLEGEAEVSSQLGELRNGLAEMLPILPLSRRIFVVLHYCEQRSFAEVGDVLGVTEARVGQIRQEVLESLRNPT